MDSINCILTRHNVKTIFKPYRKIESILRAPKDRKHLENQGVYQIPCQDDLVYIGQSNRRVGVRLEMHKYAVTE